MERLGRLYNLVLFQNEEIFVQFNELDELDRISHACWLNRSEQTVDISANVRIFYGPSLLNTFHLTLL